MNRLTICLVALLLCFTCVSAQDAKTDSLPKRLYSVALNAGGAGYGIGPSFESMTLFSDHFGVGLSLSVPLLHPDWGFRYSPISVSPGFVFTYGRRLWKMEIAAESNIYVEWGIRPRGGEYTIQNQTFSLMLGMRRQIPWGGLLIRANLGLVTLPQDYLPRIAPGATISVGYSFKSKQIKREALPEKREIIVGRSDGDSLHTNVVRPAVIRIAPFANLELHREWQRNNDWQGLSSSSRYDFDFDTRWATHAGLVMDVGLQNSVMGLRLEVFGGLRSVRYGWSATYYSISSGGPFYRTVSIDDLQLEFDLKARMRFQTKKEDPWVFQAGFYGGTKRTLARNSPFHLPFAPFDPTNPAQTGIGFGPSIAVSKQIPLGRSTLEPFIDARCSITNIVAGLNMNNAGTSIGLIWWIGNKAH